MTQRIEQLRDWLQHAAGLGALELTPASADASFRRYFRVHHAGGTAIYDFTDTADYESDNIGVIDVAAGGGITATNPGTANILASIMAGSRIYSNASIVTASLGGTFNDDFNDPTTYMLPVNENTKWRQIGVDSGDFLTATGAGGIGQAARLVDTNPDILQRLLPDRSYWFPFNGQSHAKFLYTHDH